MFATGAGALALALRVPLLNRGLWRDEAETYFDIVQKRLPDALAMVRHNEQGPPLYFLIERAWTSAFGFGEVAMHAPSLIFGTLAAVTMYFLGRSVGNRLTGIFAGCISAVAPLALDVGSEARPYCLVLFLTAAALFAFVQCERSGERRWAVIFVIMAALLGATHFTGTLVLGLLAFAAGFRALLVRSHDATVAAIASLAGFIGAAVWFPILMSDLRRLPRYSSAPIGSIQWFQERLNYFSPFPKMRAQFDMLVEVGTLIAIAAAIVKRHLGKMDWHLGLFAFLAIAGFTIESMAGVSLERHLVALAVPAWVAMAMLLERFVSWVRNYDRQPGTPALLSRVFASMAVLWVIGGGFLTYPGAYASIRQPLSGVRDIAAVLAALPRDNRLIVAAPDWMGWTLGYYVLRPRGEAIHAVGTWNHAELYNANASAWFDPFFASKAADRIVRESAGRHGYVALVINPRARESGGIPYSKSLDVRSALERRLSVRFDRVFPSPREPAELMIFSAANR